MIKSRSFYADMTDEDREELNSNFLVESWSYSKVSEFSRNEKAFEMSHIYGVRPKLSSTTIAGNAYHYALETYFKEKKDGNTLDMPSLEALAFEYLSNVRPFVWKLQKTTPSIDECIQKATKTVVSLLSNFYKEKGVYEDEVDEILEIEVYCKEYLTVNGIDIPIPCHAKIDVVFRLKNGRIAVVDHKSKSAFSNEEELKLLIGRQAITYKLCYESKSGIEVDEAWFVENKYSQNKNGDSQLNRFVVPFDQDTCRLYEALLYEPLKRMIDAISDPDYVYMINDQDSFIDKAEIYNFWCKTMIAEVEDFNVAENKKEMVAKRLRKIRDASIVSASPQIIKRFKENASEFIQYDFTDKDMTPSEKVEHILRSFGIITKVSHLIDGYSANTLLLEFSAGVKITSIMKHKLDIANVLNVPNVRISQNLVMYQGKSYVGVEHIKTREKDVIFDPKALVDQKIPLGLDNYGNVIHWDLNNQSTPHALVCGSTGSGKSVSLKSTIEYAIKAKVGRIVILDPKYEFVGYSNKKGVEVFNSIEDIERRVEDLVIDMNAMISNGTQRKTLVILDEFADAYMMARTKKELAGSKSLAENIQSLLQKGRSSGFRLALATQRADAKTISGSAKVNLPVQICFRVGKEVDSRVVLDEVGAESLAGFGDGLIRSPEYPDIVRFQAYYKPD